MNEPIERFTFAGYTIELYQDFDPLNPRKDRDNLGDMYYRNTARECFGECPVSVEALHELAERDDCVRLPVYAYVHSGAMVSTEPFSCPWDSGQRGWIIAEPKKIKEFLGYDWPLTEEQRAHVVRNLKIEVETFSQYLQGEVYGYRVLDGEDEVDACWGYYGLDDCRNAARDLATYLEGSTDEKAKYTFNFLEADGCITTQSVEDATLMGARLRFPSRFSEAEILSVVRTDLNGKATVVLGGTGKTILSLEESGA